MTPTATSPTRDPLVRLNDFYEIHARPRDADAQEEAARCMSCGAPFCQPSGGYGAGCPLDNKIPEWNELVQHDRWQTAYERLRLTNNFPEFTSRVCPAPCQDACIHGINGRPVSIKGIERAIADHAEDEEWLRPRPPVRRTGRAVAVVGSGPAGLAAADQLNREGHYVAVFERADRAGGLLMYGVPNMKLDKGVIQRRVALMAREGVRFRTGVDVGRDVSTEHLLRHYDAVLLACGAQRARDSRLPGRDLGGIHQAMDYLTAATRTLRTDRTPAISAAGKDVIVIGGGDTGADCVATALRQGCRGVLNLSRRDRPPQSRDDDHPWPGPPGVYTLDYAHAEGLARFGRDPREFNVEPVAFVGDDRGNVSAIRVRRAGAEATEDLPAQLVLLAIGFTGHDASPLLQTLGVAPQPPSDDMAAARFATNRPGVFLAGDMRRGASLVVWAIAEGRHGAAAVSRYLAEAG